MVSGAAQRAKAEIVSGSAGRTMAIWSGLSADPTIMGLKVAQEAFVRRCVEAEPADADAMGALAASFMGKGLQVSLLRILAPHRGQ